MLNKLILQEIKAILFDVDNTLLATDFFVLENIKKVVKKLVATGLILPVLSDQEISKVQAENLPFEEIFQRLFIGQTSDGRQLWEIVLESYRAEVKDLSYQSTAGSVEAIKKIVGAGLVVGLVTNRVKMLQERLKQAGFDISDFAFMSLPLSKEFAKPHPRAFEEALNKLRKMNIYADQVIVFGDHADDYYSAFYQDINFVAVLQGQTKREDFKKTGIEDGLIIEDLSEAEQAIEKVVMINKYKSSLKMSSAVDGRYGFVTRRLPHYFSEYAFYRYRIKVEIEHLIALSEYFNGQVVRPLSGEEKKYLRCLSNRFTWHEAWEVLQYDHLGRNGIGPVEHDTKACELWLAEKLEQTTMFDLKPFIHIFLTSEDTRNLALRTMLKDAFNEVFAPDLLQLTNSLSDLTKKYSDAPVMGRTHFQPASPTTYGKIFADYLIRFVLAWEHINSVKFSGKVNGAVGAYNSFVAAYPELDWISYSQELTKRFGLATVLWTDQRGQQSDVVRFFQALQEIGNVVKDFSTDLSLYAGLGTMYFTKVDSHVGSSVMPHKINPWFAEVAEGNINKANALINGLANCLLNSRLQRDLSDHDWERSYGEIFGYEFIALKHLLIAIEMVKPNLEFAEKEIISNPQIITEALQTILRKYEKEDAYEILKQNFRGIKVTAEDIYLFIEGLNVADEIKQELLQVVNPLQYIGLASKLTKMAIEKYNEIRPLLSRSYLDRAK
jgi:adenylosuccinate lyase